MKKTIIIALATIAALILAVCNDSGIGSDKGGEADEYLRGLMDRIYDTGRDTAITPPDTTVVPPDTNTTVKSFTISFNTAGGTPTSISPVTVDSGGVMGERYPADPTKTNNVFTGWFDDDNTQYHDSTIIIKNVMLTAGWNDTTPPPPTQFSVLFNANGGTMTGNNIITVDSNTAIGTTRFPAPPTMANNVFTGWFDDASTQYHASTVIIKDLTLTAGWNDTTPIPPAQYIVRFRVEGVIIDSVTVDSGNYIGIAKFPEAPQCASGVFEGWFAGNVPYNATTVITEHAVLNARCQGILINDSVSVNFFDGGTLIKIITVPIGGALTQTDLAPLNKIGYTFTGWYRNNLPYDPTAPINSDIMLIANWERIRYTLAVSAFPENTGLVARDPSAAVYDSGTVVEVTALPIGGYAFNGWTGAAESSDNPITITMNGNKELIANFVPNYTVTWNYNGGSPVPTQTTVIHGNSIAAPAAMTRAGHFFAGWYRDAGFNTVASFPITNVTSNITLHARWWTVNFVDSRDNQTYRTVLMPDGKVWMAENLNYRNDSWYSGTTWSFTQYELTPRASWCYDNDPANCIIYGRLYTWDAARNACPSGWRLPTRQDWHGLFQAVGGVQSSYRWSNAGHALKSSPSDSPSWDGANTYGFSALPGGDRWVDGNFGNVGDWGSWWSATEYDADYAGYVDMFTDRTSVHEVWYYKIRGFSVRCIRD